MFSFSTHLSMKFILLLTVNIYLSRLDKTSQYLKKGKKFSIFYEPLKSHAS